MPEDAKARNLLLIGSSGNRNTFAFAMINSVILCYYIEAVNIVALALAVINREVSGGEGRLAASE